MKKIQWIDKKLYNGSVSAMTWTIGAETRVRGYKYTYDGNRITSVLEDADPVTQNGSMDYPGVKREMEFAYNEWGALIKDESRGITDISYDRFGNPLRVSFSDGSYTENVYSASGNKLKTTHATALNGTVTGRTTTEYRGNVIYRDGKLDMVLFPGGYATVSGTSVTFHYYTQDYLGNNRAVINGSTGAVEQTVAYYPYCGVIADLSTNLSKQPYKFGGKELVTANGLNEYDFGARQYYSTVPGYTRPDNLAEKYSWLSPYLYCANNPVNLVDRNGEEPSTYEAALMSSCVDKDDDYISDYERLKETKWMISEKTFVIKMNYNGFGENGFQSMLFEKTVDVVTEYEYAFAGTNSIENGLEDVAQLIGVAPQYSSAIDNARALSSELGDAELTFVGHSLGGGEAAAASMATNRRAITFNRASVSTLTRLKHDLGSTRNVKNIITKSLDSSGNFVMEPLSKLQNSRILGVPVMKTQGITEFIKVYSQLGLLEAHSINTVINYLRK